MNCKTKYRAFTIFEVMTAIVTTSLIAAFSYGAYHMIIKDLDKDSKEQNCLNEMIILEKTLTQLVATCEAVELSDNILFFNYTGHYEYAEIGDTIVILSKGISHKHKTLSLSEWSVEYLDKTSDYVSSFEISLIADDQIFSFSFRKIYPKLFLYRYNMQ